MKKLKSELSHFKLAMHICQISSRTNEQQQIDGLDLLFAVCVSTVKKEFWCRNPNK